MDIFDILYLPTISNRKEKLFNDGWGGKDFGQIEISPPSLKDLKELETIDIRWNAREQFNNMIVKRGSFATTTSREELPKESLICHLELIRPVEDPDGRMPVVIHFAASGDVGFERRRQILAKPLLKRGIASLIIESPYYGLRKPKKQVGTWIRTVRDLLILGKASVEEGRSICVWLHRNGFGPISVSGFSRGGLTASIVASITPLPLGVASLVSCAGGAPVFTEGLIQHACDWETLGRELKLSEKYANLGPQTHLANLLNYTHIDQFPLPMKPDAAIFLAAKDDGIIPAHSARNLSKAWPGSELRWVNGGHVRSFFFQRKAFRQAIIDSLERITKVSQI